MSDTSPFDALRDQLLGAAEAQRAALKSTKSPVAQPFYDRILASTREQLDDDVFDIAYDAGRKLTAEAAMAEACAAPP